MRGYQFQIDGRAIAIPKRKTWREAAQDAVDAGYGIWKIYSNGVRYVKLDQQAEIVEVKL